MDPLILAAMTSTISALVGALVSGILTKARATTSRQRAVEEAMRSLLKAELFDLHHTYVERGEPMPAVALELAASADAVYHDQLGGNGLGTRLYQELASTEISHGSKGGTHE